MINNSSKLPLTFSKRTEKIISSISFRSNGIAKIIQDLDPNKDHDHDMISIRMLKIRDLALKKVSFLMNGKKPVGFQSIKR